MEYIIVTGTSRGIGFELSKLLANAGYKVLALSRNEKPIKNLKHKNIQTFSFDVSSVSDREKLASYLKDNGKVRALINNAGRLLNKPFLETTDEEFKSVYEVNVFGVAAITKLVIPYMSSTGHVLTISSMGGIQGSAKFPGLSAYSSSKGAVLTFTELLAEEFKETGPSFNALALGAVQTEMLEEAFPGYKAPVSAIEMAEYVMNFALNGQKLYNGKILQVSSSTP
ncbi:SDR family NAD(P)-dependent oxidoreductase [Maribacter arcticus]|jgi:3-oxoacyl-[acyl-carrier protein] reductase|uniref:Short-chain dehydrogenase n=1 Tax=Maribacter arcticus TaxID=561365 RepID=A0A1T5DIN8_9FLAO|nr:SDR family oxidoreductase [Maribacter arcticus]SKB71497.1 Short-chain dehydrogenase [Maribacter arcticus]|tara:strand:+ start:2740 stop:3417 length:678 start_codon:yes stop_codon:yes gene_type:complete